MKSRVFATEYYRLKELEDNLREYTKVMMDEPDEWIKLSEIYHSLKRILGDEI